MRREHNNHTCEVCGSPFTSPHQDARFCKQPACKKKAQRAAQHGHVYVASGALTKETLQAALAERPDDLLRQRLGTRYPLTRLSDCPLTLGDGIDTWIVISKIGKATPSAIRELQQALKPMYPRPLGVLVAKAFGERELKACARLHIIAIEWEEDWMKRPRVSRICERRTSPDRSEKAPKPTDPYQDRGQTESVPQTGVKSIEICRLSIEGEAILRCSHCQTPGDAQLILYCGGECRQPFCTQCLSKDAEGLWICPQCLGVKPTEEVPWWARPIPTRSPQAHCWPPCPRCGFKDEVGLPTWNGCPEKTTLTCEACGLVALASDHFDALDINGWAKPIDYQATSYAGHHAAALGRSVKTKVGAGAQRVRDD